LEAGPPPEVVDPSGLGSSGGPRHFGNHCTRVGYPRRNLLQKPYCVSSPAADAAGSGGSVAAPFVSGGPGWVAEGSVGEGRVPVAYAEFEAVFGSPTTFAGWPGGEGGGMIRAGGSRRGWAPSPSSCGSGSSTKKALKSRRESGRSASLP